MSAVCLDSLWTCPVLSCPVPAASDRTRNRGEDDDAMIGRRAPDLSCGEVCPIIAQMAISNTSKACQSDTALNVACGHSSSLFVHYAVKMTAF
ncbi:hypothetical protein IWX50DRAFT_470701 [Phyllosticta citricarpa]